MSDESPYDLLVIGSGPGGYVCAIRAAQLGLKTALVEKDPHLGGTCLNVGCIPSKALLHSTEIYHFLQKHGENHGIKTGKLAADIAKLMENKNAVVDRLRGGVEQLVSKRGIDILKGLGRFTERRGEVEILNDDGNRTVQAKHTVIATGSTSVELPFLKFDGKKIVSSDDAIAFERVPKKLVVVGAGAIGLELGSVWARLGSEVTVVELLDRVAPTFDPDISKLAARIFKKQGMKIELGAKVTGSTTENRKRYLTAERKGKETAYEADKILVCVGRRPYTDGLQLDSLGLKLDERGRVNVNEHFQTEIDGVYAIGDVITGPMLAHKAEEEGVAVAELIAGHAGHVNYDVIPNVIYTDPEIASVGLGETEAREKGHEVRTGTFGVAANGRAIASDATDGTVKVIADAETDKLMGVQIIAKNASEMIGNAVAHMEYGGSAEDLARTVTAHPTVSESIKEAALAADGRGIHSL